MVSLIFVSGANTGSLVQILGLWCKYWVPLVQILSLWCKYWVSGANTGFLVPGSTPTIEDQKLTLHYVYNGFVDFKVRFKIPRH